MYIILLILICYTIFLFRLLFYVLFSKNPDTEINPILPVSIVIPFRNEQQNLSTLLKSLKEQTYRGQIEILLINDGSTDESMQVIENDRKNIDTMIIVLDSVYNPKLNMTSKQQALELGIRHAQFDWVALTDADMILQPEWISSLMETADKNVSLVFGHTSISGPNNLFNQLQKFQLEFLFAVAYAFYKAGITGSCMGNNLLISKKAYNKSGGHKAVGYNIVEDRGLLNLFNQKKMAISCTNPFSPFAHTYPCLKWKQFFQQIKRWSHGGLNYRSSLLPIGLLFSMQNLFLILTCTTFLPKSISIAAAVNFLLTWLFISLTFKAIKSPQKPIFFPVFYLFLFFESIYFLFSVFSGNDIEWKGRKINHP